MKTMRMAEMFLGLGDDDPARQPRRRSWQFAGTLALAAFAFTACGDDLPCVLDDLDGGNDALDDGNDDSQTRTRTRTRTGKFDDTATGTNCSMTDNTSATHSDPTRTQTRTRTGRLPR